MQSCYANEFALKLSDINNDIARAKKHIGQPHKNIILVAVSKGQSISKIKTAYDQGLRDFGESYAQELNEKIAWAKSLGLDDIRWHFLGGIQKNKIKFIVNADFIHSLSSIEHAKIINEKADEKLKIFVQINLAQQEQRQGFTEDKVTELWPEFLKLEKLEILGLMAILPQDPNKAKKFWFEKMAQLKDMLSQKFGFNYQLSMGMSDDFLEAIEHGADFIRIGEKLFGPRQ